MMPPTRRTDRSPAEHRGRTRTRSERQQGKKALVLAGGGAKGCFEAGAVKYLWERGLRPDIICGTSIGAVNGIKLAEGRESSAVEVEQMWLALADGTLRIWEKDAVQAKVIKRIKRSITIDEAIPALFGNLDYLKDDVRRQARRLHCMHWMAPFRRLLKQYVNPRAVATSGISYRVGIVDAVSGGYFSVTEPHASWRGTLGNCGLLEQDGPHARSPVRIKGSNGNPAVVRLQDALYASVAMPVFMEPPIAVYADNRTLMQRRDEFDLIEVTFPRNLLFLMATLSERVQQVPKEELKKIKDQLAEWNERYEDNLGMQRTLADVDLEPYWKKGVSYTPPGTSSKRLWLDGGLRNIAPLSTALRLGAREIYVITGTPWDQARWKRAALGSNGLVQDTPIAKYLGALIEMWSQEVALQDVYGTIAYNEFLGWMYRCFSLLDSGSRERLRQEFNDYWHARAPTLSSAVGGASWLGKNEFYSYATPPRSTQTRRGSPYGNPFDDEGCRILLVEPEEFICDALDFDSGARIKAGLKAGYEAAEEPRELSFPVPNDQLETLSF